MGFPRKEYWCGLLFPPPGDLFHPGIKPTSPGLLLWQVDSYHWANREAYTHIFPSWPSFLKGHQMAKRCSHMHWIHHHQNKQRSFCFLGVSKALPYLKKKKKEISEFVKKWMVWGAERKDIIITQVWLNLKVPAHLVSGSNYQMENFS